ncbi:helix-turn-helix domain-containing protein [Microbacterium sp. IEGM 1404]|uniref:helix-turn-helix domain-containing protein n=1 Tax=Microbacterium sp. IEGM 1404 TaxID=3047084 RepID=UPI0024B6369C|nr:helix-turn-helix domain-containing protein [Microbacterium sp. IEGM 1404]MDI9891938.1 helix-turn-helix domain-containing protein [Microbacterium sp. IEGM 1404]
MTDDEALSDYVPDDRAAELLHVSKAALRQWRYEGRGPRYTKAGRRILYSKRELVRWLESNERQGTAVA